MKYFTIIRSNRLYWIEENIFPELDNLIVFLLREIDNKIDHAKQQFDKYHRYGGNACLAEIFNKKIKIFHLYANDEDTIMPYNKFLDLLDKWKIMYEKKPEKAIITMDENYNFDILY